MSKRTRNFWIELVILVLLTAAGITAFSISAMSPLSRDDLRTQAGDLRSFAAAGRLLAIQYSRGETTEKFFRNQTELLQDKASAEENSLRSAKTKPGLDSQLDELGSLASEVSSGLNEMHDGSNADSSASRLELLTHQLNAQEDRLK